MEKIRQNSLVCRTWKTKTAAAALAVIAAVALPQLVHLLGAVTGFGSVPGEVFLPMHLAIFLVGFFAGPWAGLAAGALSPAVSFLLTSAWNQPMPALAALPYMMVELGVYGLVTGLLASLRLGEKRLPSLAILLIAQIAGRAVRALALVIGVLGFSFGPALSTIWTSLLSGLPGLVLQWVIVPLLVYYVERKSGNA